MREGMSMEGYEQEQKREANRIEQTRRYEASGLTAERVRELLDAVVEEHGDTQRAYLEHDQSMYVNSSDPLPDVLKAVDVRGKRVATVAGAGDFPELFLFGEAESVRIFDISSFACLWTELKMQAAATLSYEEYQSFFRDADTMRDEGSEERPVLFGTEQYPLVRPHLSEQARVFFDALQTPPYDTLTGSSEECGPEGRYSNRGFLRYREGGFVSRCLSSEEEYNALQRQIREKDWEIEPVNAETFLERQKDFGAEVFYMSNIGIQPRNVLTNALEFYRAGAPRVVFTVLREGTYFLPPFSYTHEADPALGKKRWFVRIGGQEIVPGAVVKSHDIRFRILSFNYDIIVGSLYLAYDGNSEDFTKEELLADVKYWTSPKGFLGRYSPEVLEKARVCLQDPGVRKEVEDAAVKALEEISDTQDQGIVREVVERIEASFDLLDIPLESLRARGYECIGRALVYQEVPQPIQDFFGISTEQALARPETHVSWRQAALESRDAFSGLAYLRAHPEESPENVWKDRGAYLCKKKDFFGLVQLEESGLLSAREIMRLYRENNSDASGLVVDDRLREGVLPSDWKKYQDFIRRLKKTFSPRRKRSMS